MVATAQPTKKTTKIQVRAMAENRRIKFSEMWDKLRPDVFEPGAAITTVRGYKVGKHHYYEDNIGHQFDVVLDGDVIGKAVLNKVRPDLAANLSLTFIRRDTHQDMTREGFNELMEKFYGMSDIAVLVLTFTVTEVTR